MRPEERTPPSVENASAHSSVRSRTSSSAIWPSRVPGRGHDLQRADPRPVRDAHHRRAHADQRPPLQLAAQKRRLDLTGQHLVEPELVERARVVPVRVRDHDARDRARPPRQRPAAAPELLNPVSTSVSVPSSSRTRYALATPHRHICQRCSVIGFARIKREYDLSIVVDL